MIFLIAVDEQTVPRKVRGSTYEARDRVGHGRRDARCERGAFGEIEPREPAIISWLERHSRKCITPRKSVSRPAPAAVRIAWPAFAWVDFAERELFALERLVLLAHAVVALRAPCPRCAYSSGSGPVHVLARGVHELPDIAGEAGLERPVPRRQARGAPRAHNLRERRRLRLPCGLGRRGLGALRFARQLTRDQRGDCAAPERAEQRRDPTGGFVCPIAHARIVARRDTDRAPLGVHVPLDLGAERLQHPHEHVRRVQLAQARI